jgi:UDP-glucose 4-epimerase
MLFASSVSIYGSVGDRALNENDICDPSSCYGVSKLAGEGYLRIFSKQLPYVNMRMFNVYGPGQDLDNLRQGMVSIYLAQAIRIGNIHINGSIDRFRDYIFIDDLVEAWYRATTRDDVSNISINIGTGIRTSVKQLLNIIKDELPMTKWYVEGATLGDQFGHYSNNKILVDKLGISEFTSLNIGIRKFITSTDSNL